MIGNLGEKSAVYSQNSLLEFWMFLLCLQNGKNPTKQKNPNPKRKNKKPKIRTKNPKTFSSNCKVKVTNNFFRWDREKMMNKNYKNLIMVAKDVSGISRALRIQIWTIRECSDAAGREVQTWAVYLVSNNHGTEMAAGSNVGPEDWGSFPRYWFCSLSFAGNTTI